LARDSTSSEGARGDDAAVPLHVLARAAQRGRRRARDRFARRLDATVKVLVRRLLASNSLRESEFEDVVQEALLKIATELPRLEVRSEASLYQWIKTIVTNVIRNLHAYERAEKRDSTRQRSRRGVPANDADSDSPSEVIAQDPPLPEIVSDRELFERAIAALRQLAPDEVYAVRRIELEGETIAAVAKELGLGESTIRQRLARGLARIGQRVNEEASVRRRDIDST
jgi:RNA polymerase sigma factor (sigma-70 family)